MPKLRFRSESADRPLHGVPIDIALEAIGLAFPCIEPNDDFFTGTEEDMGDSIVIIELNFPRSLYGDEGFRLKQIF